MARYLLWANPRMRTRRFSEHHCLPVFLQTSHPFHSREVSNPTSAVTMSQDEAPTTFSLTPEHD
jgi:hypothetical protein